MSYNISLVFNCLLLIPINMTQTPINAPRIADISTLSKAGSEKIQCSFNRGMERTVKHLYNFSTALAYFAILAALHATIIKLL